ncbi:MAG TPA: hypothetical protein VGV89_09550 [Thermoplasmata archaeon]|nr:hypothetical protein [Thermoplasmata archaeon]
MARRREKLQVTIPGELIAWMDLQIKKRRFHHRSHAVEVALLELKTSMATAGRSV